METFEKIRTMREINQWSQEEVAEKLGMSTTGYAKIERGQTNVSVEKLKQIAHIFNVNVANLLADQNKPFVYVVGDNHNANIYGCDMSLVNEMEKQKLIISHQTELLEKQKEEIATLKEIITLLKNR